jgi:hypothetical protein
VDSNLTPADAAASPTQSGAADAAKADRRRPGDAAWPGATIAVHQVVLSGR